MDTLAHHISLAIDLLMRYSELVGDVDSVFRHTTNHLAELHRRLGIPTDAYGSVGMSIVKTLTPFFSDYVESSQGTEAPVTSDDLTKGFVTVYTVSLCEGECAFMT